MNPVIEFIHSRRSIGKLVLPIPTREELSVALQCAMTAPDHKQLKPWQVVVMTGTGLEEFAQALLQASIIQAQKKGEVLDELSQTRLLTMPKRAPMIIMVATKLKEHEKVPAFEQMLSTGAMIQNLLLALHSQGYRTVWRSGDLIDEPSLKAFFNVADKDTICGFVYVGSSDVVMPEREPVALDDFVVYKGEMQ